MAISASPQSFHNRRLFFVEIDGVIRASFKNCSDLSMSFEVVQHHEGGTAIPNKSPGRMTVDDVTLERGVINGDNDLYDWFIQVGDVSVDSPLQAGVGTGVGLLDNQYKREVDVVQMDRDGLDRQRYRLHGAWPRTIVLGNWESDSDEILIERVVLAVDYISKIPRAAA